MTDIQDIAREAGVSVTTARRVLRGGNKETWPSAVRRGERIRQVALQMGYQSNWCAASLARRSTRLIALVHHQIVPVPTDQWLGIIQELTEALAEQHYDLQFIAGANSRTPQMLMDGRFDGCIVIHRLSDPIAHAIQQSGLPTVLLNVLGCDAYPRVVNDDVAGARTATRHLIELGHRCIAYLHHNPEASPHFTVNQRYEGICQALAEAGIRQPVLKVFGEDETALAKIMAADPRPTAVVTYDDSVAIPLLHACWVRGVRVPEDLSVTTFNDTRQTRTSIPPLTTMSVPGAQAARHAAQMMLEQLNRKDDHATSRDQPLVQLTENLVVGDSTAAAPESSRNGG